METKNSVQKIRRQKPLVHNITNHVVMNWTANGLLALGASPVMAHALEEVEEMTSISKSLVINIGTLSSSWVKAMKLSCKVAQENKIPLVLDPVGVGATEYRTKTAQELIQEFRPTVIRGNASEISALRRDDVKTKGVDSSLEVDQAHQAAVEIYEQFGSVVCITGPSDLIVGHHKTELSGGHPLMGQTTGMGCMASAVVGAFLAVEINVELAVGAAITTLARCGEAAAKKSHGQGSFQMEFLDALSSFEV